MAEKLTERTRALMALDRARRKAGKIDINRDEFGEAAEDIFALVLDTETKRVRRLQIDRWWQDATSHLEHADPTDEPVMAQYDLPGLPKKPINVKIVEKGKTLITTYLGQAWRHLIQQEKKRADQIKHLIVWRNDYRTVREYAWPDGEPDNKDETLEKAVDDNRKTE